MQSLKHLDISGCKQLSAAGVAPLSALAPSLVTLRAQHCAGLKGPAALAPLSALTALTSLNLGGCVGLHGAALGALGGLAGLRHLSLEGCRCVQPGQARVHCPAPCPGPGALAAMARKTSASLAASSAAHERAS